MLKLHLEESSSFQFQLQIWGHGSAPVSGQVFSLPTPSVLAG